MVRENKHHQAHGCVFIIHKLYQCLVITNKSSCTTDLQKEWPIRRACSKHVLQNPQFIIITFRMFKDLNKAFKKFYNVWNIWTKEFGSNQSKKKKFFKQSNVQKRFFMKSCFNPLTVLSFIFFSLFRCITYIHKHLGVSHDSNGYWGIAWGYWGIAWR